MGSAGYLRLEGGLDVVRVVVNALATPIPTVAAGQKPNDAAAFAQSLRDVRLSHILLSCADSPLCVWLLLFRA